MTINERIFYLMDREDKRQKDLAAFLGVKNNTVSEWKSRGTCPTADKIIPICSFFGVSVTWMLTGEGEMFADKPPAHSDDGEAEANILCEYELINDFRKLQKEHKERVLNDIRMLLLYQNHQAQASQNM